MFVERIALRTPGGAASARTRKERGRDVRQSEPLPPLKSVVRSLGEKRRHRGETEEYPHQTRGPGPLGSAQSAAEARPTAASPQRRAQAPPPPLLSRSFLEGTPEGRRAPRAGTWVGSERVDRVGTRGAAGLIDVLSACCCAVRRILLCHLPSVNLFQQVEVGKRVEAAVPASAAQRTLVIARSRGDDKADTRCVHQGLRKCWFPPNHAVRASTGAHPRSPLGALLLFWPCCPDPEGPAPPPPPPPPPKRALFGGRSIGRPSASIGGHHSILIGYSLPGTCRQAARRSADRHRSHSEAWA